MTVLEYGVNISPTSDTATIQRDVADAAALGAGWVRTSIEQPNRNAQAVLTTCRAACDAHGMKLWNTCQPTNHLQPVTQAELDAYGGFTAMSASICDATGTDNEINGYGQNPQRPPDPAVAAVAVLAQIQWRDKLAPGRILVTPEMCPGSGALPPKTGEYVEPLLFITQMFDHEPQILRSKHLWCGWHGYCDFRYAAWSDKANFPWNTCRRQRALQIELKARGKTHMVIADGEYGAATGPAGFYQTISAVDQAQRVRDYDTERRLQVALGIHSGPWIWYCIRDRTPQGPSDWAAFCGLYDIHGNKKPAADAFAAVAKAGSTA